MTGKRTKLKPSRRPRPEDYKGATRRAREFADRLAASGRTFSDSAEIIRQDRDTRI